MGNDDVGGDKNVAISAALARQRAMREAGIEIERLDPIEKARRHPHSLRLAITAKCVECMGGVTEPNFRAHIRECSSSRCSLYPIRPYQHGQKDRPAA